MRCFKKTLSLCLAALMLVTCFALLPAKAATTATSYDVNCDQQVNNDDVVLLLWHTLFPGDYPLSVSGDLNGDGKVNNGDVVLLLWYTLFPEEELVLTAKQAFVYDCQTGEFTYLMGQPEDKVYPASVTKLFTAYVALQYLQPDQLVTAGDALDLVGPGSSVADIEKGNVLTVEMLVQAMLLPSGNDASYILAAEAGRVIGRNESISASTAVRLFVREMNMQARTLGMTRTRFVNPDGYHESTHYSSNADLVIIGKLSLENETIMKYANVSSETVTFASGETKNWKNTNALIDPASPYYSPYATGLKTGQTPSAGSCLLSSFNYEGKRWIIGVFGCPTEGDRFVDTLKLFENAIAK